MHFQCKALAFKKASWNDTLLHYRTTFSRFRTTYGLSVHSA